jgi:hypothetical protein
MPPHMDLELLIPDSDLKFKFKFKFYLVTDGRSASVVVLDHFLCFTISFSFFSMEFS